MSKKLNLDNIQPLPKHLRKQVYGDDYNDTWKLRYSGLSDSERRTLRTFLKYQEAKEIYWVPEVDYPKGKHSPDLLIDGVRVEIKGVATLSSIDHQLKKAYSQIDDTGIVLIDASASLLDTASIRHDIARIAHKYDIASFALVIENDLVVYNTKKTIQRPQTTGARDPKSSYVSILPNPGQKVKHPARYLLLHFVSIWGILILGGFTNEEEGSTAKDY